MDKRYQVFISSTYTDLRDEREIVMQTLMKMGCIPAGMELFPAADEEQLEFIKKVIDDCDYYIIIIGGRYGSTTEEGLSYTEKEYDYAIEKGIKVVALIHGKPEDIPSGKSETEPALRDRLEAFRVKVSKNRLVSFWTEAKDLSGIVALSVMNAIRMYPAIGWVRANQVSNTELLTELNDLRKNKEQLEAEIQTLKSNSDASIFSPKEESEFSYIFSKLSGSHNAIMHITLHKQPLASNPEIIKRDYIVEYSLIRILFENVKKNVIDFKRGEFLRFLDEKLKSGKALEGIDTKGLSFNGFYPETSLQGDLMTLGFLYTENRTRDNGLRKSVARNFNVFIFSEKLYRFVSWLEYYNKIENEPVAGIGDFLGFLQEQFGAEVIKKEVEK